MEPCPEQEEEPSMATSLLSVLSVTGSVTSRASTESGIHMGSEHDNPHGQETPEPVLNPLSLLNVKRSHSYNVSDTQAYQRMKAPVRPKSFVSGWEHSTISPDDILLWHSQLGKLQQYWKPEAMSTVSNIAKAKKKESLRTRAKSLLNYVKEKKHKHHKSSISSTDSRCTDDTPDSSSSCMERSLDQSLQELDRSNNEADKSNDLAESLSIIKVFGCHIAGHNAQYRSVLATADTTVIEVKKQAISKYGCTDTCVDHYILCDVIGNYVGVDGALLQPSILDFGCSSEEWVTKCIRSLTDNEKPLVLQSDWSVQEGHSRRFELRTRRKLELAKKEKVHLFHESTAEVHSGSIGLHRVPHHTPFLLLINGYNPSLDYLIYPLHEGTTTITPTSNTPTSNGQHYIALHAPDISTNYLNIRREGGQVSIEVTTRVQHVTVNKAVPSSPLLDGDMLTIGEHYSFIYKDQKSEVAEKKESVTSDPGLNSPDTQRTLSPGTVTSLSPNGGLNCGGHQHAEPRFIFNPEHKEGVLENILCYPNLCHRHPLMCALGTIMCLRHCFDNYNVEELKEIIALVIDKLKALGKTAQLKAANMLKDDTEKPSPTMFLKAMVRLLSNTLEIVHFIKMQPLNPALDLTEHIVMLEGLSVSLFEHVAYHSAKMLYELLPAVIDEMPTPEAVSEACPECGLEGCTEGCTGETNPPEENYSKTEKRWSIPVILTVPRKRKMKMRPRKESLSTVNEETFKDHKSKSCNNIHEWKFNVMSKHNSSELIGSRTQHNAKKQNRHKSRHEMLHVGHGMNRLVRLLEKFHCLASSSKLNSSMIRQLFTSLFFFANTTLFNTLIDPVSASKFFNWRRGTQMRVNLDHLLRWAKHHNYTDISLKYFSKLNSLLDLISIPKHELIKSSWKALSEAFKSLNPTQLNHILTNYQVLHHPSAWSPCPPLLSMRSVKEEMSSYPPLQLPTRGFLLYNNPDLPETVRSSLSRLTKQLTDITNNTVVNDDVFHNQHDLYYCKLKKVSKSIGLKLAKSDTCVICVSEIVKGSPAYWDGSICLKDSLLQINGTEVTGKSVAFCKDIITASKDYVSLKLKRNT